MYVQTLFSVEKSLNLLSNDNDRYYILVSFEYFLAWILMKKKKKCKGTIFYQTDILISYLVQLQIHGIDKEFHQISRIYKSEKPNKRLMSDITHISKK